MRITRKEFASDYGNYHFGYSIWAVLEAGEEPDAAYSQGFLPYSGPVESLRKSFYMARSLRVPLNDFQLNSENRRILKKASPGLRREPLPFDQFDTGDPTFQSFCSDYFRERHQFDIAGTGKLASVLSAGLITDLVTYREEGGRAVGYVLLVSSPIMSHFWFSFYDPSLATSSLGMWMMIQEVMQAKEAGRVYIYLGTCYGERALYKTNFNPVQWWDGSNWSSDLRTLKNLARQETK